MVKKAETCPVCGESDKTLKVSQIYLESISKDDLIQGLGKKNLRMIFSNEENEPYKGKITPGLIKAFTPPSGKSVMIRQVNPDQVMVLLVLISFFFLYNIYLQQPKALGLSGGLFAVLIGGYVVFRKAIKARYQRMLDEEKFANEKVKNSINYWMELYFCARDNIVYHPGRNISFNLSEMKEYLSKIE